MSSPSRLLRAALAALLVLGAADTAWAQQSGLGPGARVRVRSPRVVAPVVGNLQSIRNDTLVMIEDGTAAQVWTFPRSDVSRLEISEGMHRGHRRLMLRNGLIGAGAGALGGFLLAALLDQSSGDEYDRVASALVGAAVGGGVGVAYGYRRVEERWAATSFPRRVSLAPAPRGVRMALSLAF